MSVSAFQQHLKSLGACSDAREWSKDLTATQTWETCEKADWLLWWTAKTSANSKQEIVKVACKIARLVLKHVRTGELRPLQAIEAAEAWAENPTPENLAKVKTARNAYAAYAAADAADAAYAAYAAADAAYAAYAAADAAYAAADAADAAYAADAADAAYAAYAAADAAAYAAAYAAARKEMKEQCCKIIRETLKQPWIEVQE